MAELVREGGELVLRLTTTEKLEAIHGQLRIPLASVQAVEVLDDAVHEVHGWRVGTGVPGHVAVGTFRTSNTTTFAVVHHDTPRGVLIRLEGADYDQLIVGCDDPEGVAAELAR